MIEIIRVATRENIELVAQLADEIWHEHYTRIIGAQQVEYMIEKFQSTEAITRQTDSGELTYFLLFLNHHAEGYMAIQLRKNELFLSKLYVRASQRGRGLAKRAIEFVKGVAAENCIKRISLTVNKENAIATQAYERLGFKNEKAVVTDIGAGYVMDDYIMVLTLA